MRAGTSINPTLRAAYLSQGHGLRVILLYPWLTPGDQRIVHPALVFQTQAEQAEHVRQWLHKRLGFLPPLCIRFYDAWYDPRKGSCFPLDGESPCLPYTIQCLHYCLVWLWCTNSLCGPPTYC